MERRVTCAVSANGKSRLYGVKLKDGVATEWLTEDQLRSLHREIFLVLGGPSCMCGGARPDWAFHSEQRCGSLSENV